jgi:endoglucanase
MKACGAVHGVGNTARWCLAWIALVAAGATWAAPERAKPVPEGTKTSAPDPRADVATRQGSALRLVVAPRGSPHAGHFMDGEGQRLRLIGMNLSGMQYVAIADAATQTNWGTQLDTADGYPDFAALARWHANAVRISLYEASWNADGPNGRCRDVFGRKGKEGALANPDRLGRYRADVKQAVDAAAKAGFFVILDLHNAAPADFCPSGDRMANKDNSVRFWSSVAETFKNAPHVAFDLYNEPHDVGAKDLDLRVSHTLEYAFGTDRAGKPKKIPHVYQTAGWNDLIAAVRETGATNVVLAGSLIYSGDNTRWLQQVPDDRKPPKGFKGTWTSQLAASWHVYPKWGTSPGDAKYLTLNNNGSLEKAQEIVAAGYPVVITEFGDNNEQAPFVTHWLPKFHAAGLSYLAWAWSPSTKIHKKGREFQLTQDGQGKPTPGFGQAVMNHYRCVATQASALACP